MAEYFTIVDNEAEAKAVQDYLFSIGKVWAGDGTEYSRTKSEALFWEDGDKYITHLTYAYQAQEYEEEGCIRVTFDFAPCELKATPQPLDTITIDGKQYATSYIEKLLKEKQQ